MIEKNAIESAACEMGLVLQTEDSSKWMGELALKINDLLIRDFEKLVFILYRMDVSETKLKQLLRNKSMEDAGKLIAELMVKRQAEKLKSRQQFGSPKNNIDENEKW